MQIRTLCRSCSAACGIVVSVAPGWFDANVGQLTSSHLEIDPLTGQPPMTGIAVRLTSAQSPPIVFSKSQ